MTDKTGLESATPPRQEMLIIHDLTLRLEEALSTLCAIRKGEVDALVVSSGAEPEVFVLKGADYAHRVLLETLNEGAMTIASDTTILCANRKLAELLDRGLDIVLGSRLTRFIAPADAEAFAALLEQAAHGGAKGEIALETAGGDRVPVLMSTMPIREGQNSNYTVVVTDLRPLKEAQRALEKTNDELEERVEARTRELAMANEALRAEISARTRLETELRRKANELLQADRRKDEFLSMLAHEIRNPLAPILAAAEMLRFVAREQPAVERYRDVIERQVRNLARLVDDLLDVSRITRGAVTLRTQRVALSRIMQSAVDASRPLIDARHQEITVSFPHEPLEVVVDPTRFEQVLVNLLNNAAKYTQEGGHIDLSVAQRGDEVMIQVRDTGMGIPSDLLPRVFDLFVQGERPLDRSQGGLGVGLTLVKRLVEMHGGQIEAFSEGSGRGSEFVIRVPLAPAVERPQDGSDVPGDAPECLNGAVAEPDGLDDFAPARARVLIVEDNVDASATLTELLQLWGYEAVSARDGDAALELALTYQPEVVLIDVGLPGMDGYEVARQLRRTVYFPSSPAGAERKPLVIGITGYGQERDRHRGLEAGFDEYLVKPPDPEILRALLDRSRQARASNAPAWPGHHAAG